jgi:hypothetical protein
VRLEDGFRNEFGNDLLSAEQPSVEALNALGRRVHFGKFEVDVPLNRSNTSQVWHRKVSPIADISHLRILVDDKLVDRAIFGFDLALDVFRKIQVPFGTSFGVSAGVSTV